MNKNAQATPCLETFWIPSHEKQPLWKAPVGWCSEAACRRLNSLADVAVSRELAPLRVRRMLLTGGPGVPLPSLRRLRPLRSTTTSLLSWCARCLLGRVGVGEGLRLDPLAIGRFSASRRSSGFSLSSFSSTTTTMPVL